MPPLGWSMSPHRNILLICNENLRKGEFRANSIFPMQLCKQNKFYDSCNYGCCIDVSLSTDCDQEVRYKVVTCYDWWQHNRQTRTTICSLSLTTAPPSPGNGWFRFDLKLLMWMKLTQKHSNHAFSDSKLPEIDLHPFFPTLPVKWETARKRAVVFSHVKSKASDQNYRFYLN